jgi:two-component system, OmpR family, alkaline phosphatase synthesis response regulator PhoP
MIGKKVLLVDDDIDSLRLNRIIFINAGAQVVTANDGLEGISKLHSHRPDLVILDVMMPGGSGYEVCKQIRKISNVPVIMLTALGQEQNELDGLDAGADDYLSKPYNPEILLARAKSVIRRSEQNDNHSLGTDYDDGYLKIDFEKHQVLINGKAIRLTPIEFRLLAYLEENAGRVLTFANILQNVWGDEYQGNDDYVHIYISHLRHKIERDAKEPHYIISIRGVGYLFEKQKPTLASDEQTNQSTDH